MLTREEEVEIFIRARYPLLYILSWEERRIEAMLRQVAVRRQKRLYAWTITQGWAALDTPRATIVNPTARSPLEALDYIAQSREAALFVLKDFHYFLEPVPSLDRVVIIRRLRDMASSLKETYKTVIFLSPVLQVPPELEKDVAVLDYSLPTQEELAEALERVLLSARKQGRLKLKLDPFQREQILQAAQGLTVSEAENVFARSLVVARTLAPALIIAEKKQIIRRSRVLEYYDHTEPLQQVGGMEELKNWLRKRRLAFSEKARQFGLPEPRGVLLLGIQGCGKSLVAKAIAHEWQLPLLRLDMGKVFGRMVGESEENIRSALRLAEAISPAVLWIDEIEKGLSGTASSHYSDAGTAARVLGSFLVWLQEKTAPVFVVATSNDISLLPPELLRRGRFDEIFFVDLPTVEERQEIFAIHLAKRGRDPQRFDLARLALETEGFSGAEIEQVVIAALYDAFEADRDLVEEDLMHNIRQTIPLSQVRRDQVIHLREWARTHARFASSAVSVERAWAL